MAKKTVKKIVKKVAPKKTKQIAKIAKRTKIKGKIPHLINKNDLNSALLLRNFTDTVAAEV